MNGTSEYNINSVFKSQSILSNGEPEMKNVPLSEHSSGMPPIPPSSNQFSARSRMGVRSRYVDTFNKGGAAPTASLFHSTPAPAPKPLGNANFFVPTPIPSTENILESPGKCVITSAPILKPVQRSIKTYLRRPKMRYSRTICVHNYFDSLVHPAGWLKWNGNFALDTVYYAEFRNIRPGSRISSTKDEVKFKPNVGCERLDEVNKVVKASLEEEEMVFTLYKVKNKLLTPNFEAKGEPPNNEH
ncbi:Pectinesterase 2 [Acorus calamus]|uniref:Pectinesterase 2 n=1 Tax=Acorus calamus TaxID=4465 RepID=A0AAV9E6Y8_ACOCL|nr:Pectinesterase 2 [Acorus calamus]